MDEYFRSRRHYALVSAMLIGWTLLWIRPGPAVDQYVVLSSPFVVSITLVALVLYLGARYAIDRAGLEGPRRATTANRLDAALSHSLGAGSLIVFALKNVIAVGFTEEFNGLDLFAFGFGVMMVLSVAAFPTKKAHSKEWWYSNCGWGFVIYSLVLLVLYRDRESRWVHYLEFLLGALTAGYMWFRISVVRHEPWPPGGIVRMPYDHLEQGWPAPDE